MSSKRYINMVQYIIMKYTVEDLRTDFPDEDACLEWLVNFRWPDGITCQVCDKVTKHYRVKSRKSYSCAQCGHHVHPTAGTIFHKSTTPLTLWFYAIFLMTTTKCGISAAQVSRQLGVSYPTAWRMMHQIRLMMTDDGKQLSGQVEMDETYVHANVFKRSSARYRYGPTGARTGQIIFGMVQRGGQVKMWHVVTAGKRVVQPLIDAHVADGSLIYTDESWLYRDLHRRGYRHFTTNHGKKEYVNGNNYTQNIENTWSHLKRGIKGVYRCVSSKHLQKYANEFAWRYSHRNDVSIFWALMASVSKPASKP